MSYHIFEKEAVDMICREYGGDPRVMVIALNGAVSDELRDLCEAATQITTAIAADQGDEIGRLKADEARGGAGARCPQIRRASDPHGADSRSVGGLERQARPSGFRPAAHPLQQPDDPAPPLGADPESSHAA